MILTFFSLIGGAIALFFGLASFPLSLLGVVVALLVLCFYKTTTTTREVTNSHHKDVSDAFYETTDYVDYPYVKATCNGEEVEAEIIDDGMPHRWNRC